MVTFVGADLLDALYAPNPSTVLYTLQRRAVYSLPITPSN